eukprot:1921031-Pleurochrysis_carterae.AAC.1
MRQGGGGFGERTSVSARFTGRCNSKQHTRERQLSRSRNDDLLNRHTLCPENRKQKSARALKPQCMHGSDAPKNHARCSSLAP